MNGDNLLLRALRTCIRRVGWPNILTWSLMLITVLILIQALADNVRNLDAFLLWSIALPGLLTGWVISRWLKNELYIFVIAPLVGWGIIVLRVGNLANLALRCLYALSVLIVQSLRWKPGLPYPDAVPFFKFLSELVGRTGVLMERMMDWITLVMQRQTPHDPAAIAISWSAVIWLVAFWTAWNFYRGRFIRGLLLAISLLGAVLSFSGKNGYLLIPFFCIALALSARNAYTGQKSRWQKDNIDYSEDLGFDLTVSMTIILSLLVIAAFLAPSLSYRRVIDLVREATRPRQQIRARDGLNQTSRKSNPGPQIGLALGLQQPPSPAPPNAISRIVSTGMPQEHLLGSGTELSHRVVMVVAVAPQTALDATPEEARLYQAEIVARKPYWQAAAYDIYLGKGWATSTATQIRYAGGQSAISAAVLPVSSLLLEQHVQYVGDSYQPGGIVYAAGELVRVNQGYQVAWRNPPDKASQDPPIDMFSAA
ncbi:MAG: hypothetical protein P8Z00_22225, partial [Anaerolineales bacterium]